MELWGSGESTGSGMTEGSIARSIGCVAICHPISACPVLQNFCRDFWYLPHLSNHLGDFLSPCKIAAKHKTYQMCETFQVRKRYFTPYTLLKATLILFYSHFGFYYPSFIYYISFNIMNDTYSVQPTL